MTANVLSLVALIAIILVRVINLKDNTKKQETDKTIDNFIDKHYKKYDRSRLKQPSFCSLFSVTFSFLDIAYMSPS